VEKKFSSTTEYFKLFCCIVLLYLGIDSLPVRAMPATTIVSDPDTDDEAVPEDERFYFFCIASHQVMSKVSRRVKPKKVTFGHVRRGLEGTIDAEFKFALSPKCNLVVSPKQEEMEILGVLEGNGGKGYFSSGTGTRSDPYQIHIVIRHVQASEDE